MDSCDSFFSSFSGTILNVFSFSVILWLQVEQTLTPQGITISAFSSRFLDLSKPTRSVGYCLPVWVGYRHLLVGCFNCFTKANPNALLCHLQICHPFCSLYCFRYPLLNRINSLSITSSFFSKTTGCWHSSIFTRLPLQDVLNLAGIKSVRRFLKWHTRSVPSAILDEG